MEQRRQARIADYHRMMDKGSREEGPSKRMRTGGYHCPGSNKK